MERAWWFKRREGGREGFGGERGQYGQVSGLFSSERQWSATFFGVGGEGRRTGIEFGF